MARINSLLMKRQRQKLGLSMEDLQARSGIDKGTIYRIEAGKPGRNTKNSIRKLAAALKMTPDELVSVKVDDSDGTDAVLYSRSQMNVRISHEARNALAFVGQRFGVRAIDIVEFAPLLFLLAAEESLRIRSERLAQIRAARGTLSSLGSKFPHLTERLLNDWTGEEMESAEERSISKQDIRGELLDEIDNGSDIRPLDYDEGQHNPFVAHLRERLEAVGQHGEAGEIEAWYEGWAPRFFICRAEAAAYFGGDAEVADNVVRGVIGVHEIPKELRASETVDARLEWAQERIKEAVERQVGLLEFLDVKDLES
jgi:transcriptional regulator with XRE-family HTH domain